MKVKRILKVIGFYSYLPLLICPGMALAAVTIDSVDYGDNYRPTESQNFKEGNILINNGGVYTTDSYFYLGDRDPGNSGVDTIKITGSQSQWNALNDINLGASSPGNISHVEVSIDNGGSLISKGKISLAKEESDNADMTVSGVGSVLKVTGNQDLIVGARGKSAVKITSGAEAYISNIDIGQSQSGFGTVSIDGDNTIVTVDNDFIVGDFGTGVLSLTDNAMLNIGAGTGTLFLASQAGSTGTINIGDGTRAGTLNASTIAMGRGDALLKINTDDPDYQFKTSVRGDGNIVKEGSGTVTLLSDNSNFVGVTTIEEGQLIVSQSSKNYKLGGDVNIKKDGSLQADGSTLLGDIYNNGTLSFDQKSNGIYIGEINGEGLTLKEGDGKLVLSGDNSHFSGTTKVKSGILQVGDVQGNGVMAGEYIVDHDAELQGTAISLLGNIENNGTVTITQNSEGNYKYSLTGNGTVKVNGSSTLGITGDSSNFMGSIIVDNGSLSTLVDNQSGILGSDIDITSTGVVSGNSTSFLGDINNDGILNLLDNEVGYYSGSLSGSGTINKTNSGELVLSGDISNYTGVLDIQQGEVYLGGGDTAAEYGGTISVKSGGTLKGNGLIKGDVFLFKDSVHEVNLLSGKESRQVINGEYVNYGTLRLEGVGHGVSTLELNGKTDITNALLDISLSSKSNAAFELYTAPQVIIENTSEYDITGKFSDVTTNMPFVVGDLEYNAGDGNDISLQLTRNDVKFSDFSKTYNQKSVSAALDTANHSSDVWRAIALTDKENILSSMDQLSGELYPSLNTMILGNSKYFRSLLSERISGEHENSNKSGAEMVFTENGSPETFSLWLNTISSWDKYNHQGDLYGLDGNNQGVVLGAEIPKNSGRLGVMFTYIKTSAESKELHSDADVGNIYWGGYGVKYIDDYSLIAGVNAGWHDVNTTRKIDLYSYNDNLNGAYKATSLQLYSELSKHLYWDKASVVPYIGASGITQRTNGFKESGGDAALNVNSTASTIYAMSLGLRGGDSVNILSTSFDVSANVNWDKYFGDNSVYIDSKFNSSDSFKTEGLPVSDNVISYSIDISKPLVNNSTVGLGYFGGVSSDTYSNGMKLYYNYVF